MLKRALISIVFYAIFSLIWMAFGVPYNSWWIVTAALPVFVVILVLQTIKWI